ncbi:hypothetical protein [Microbacterium sp. NPDC087589]|uniref:hypothetical protein n=1 Tax=Microbacterium sp. NPDC087589 TaxID=3364191 RepID=UPI003818733A
MTAHLIPLSVVRWAANIVDSSGVMDKVKAWDKEDQTYQGGRPPSLGPRAVFIAWLVVGMEQQPLFATRVAEVLSERLSPEAAEIMGVPASFMTVPYEDMQNRVERATNRLLEVFDYKPMLERKGARSKPKEERLTRQRALLKGELAAIVEHRAERAVALEAKRQRFFRFTNDLLHAQYDTLPDNAKTHKLSLSIDATFLAAPSRGMSNEKQEKRLDTQTIPLDFDAGMYVRTYDQRDNWDGTADKAIGKKGYGYECELAVLVSNDPDHREAVPHIVVGFNFHVPSVDYNQCAREIFDDILDWGHGFGHVTADQAYLPGANPEVLQKPLRAAGAMLTMRYPKPESRAVKGEGTIQAEAHGAHMLEGRLMCPMTPNPQRNVMLNYNRKVAADKEDRTLSKADREARELVYRAERDALIIERAKWELRVKETKADKGVVVMTCPAVGKGRSLDCPLKPNQPTDLPKGAVPLPVLNTPKAPGAICTNASSVNVSLEVGAKYLQHYRYGSPEWEDVHTYGRQTVESYNNSLKHADNSLHDATNRRLRGTAGQGLLAIIGVLAQNARVIYEWLDQQYDEERPAIEPRTRHKRTDRRVPVKRTKKGRGMPAGRRARYGLLT